MPIDPRLHTGFSADGSSYAVADDYAKLLGQALSSYEAKTGNPRGLYESKDEFDQRRQEAPDILSHELMALGGGGGYGRPLIPRTYNVKGNIVQYDPNTGKTKTVYESPKDLIPHTETQVKNWFANNPMMRQEESDALSELNQPNADVVDILGTRHPTLLKNPPYSTRFGPIYRGAQTKKMRAENSPVENIAPNISSLASERDRLTGTLAKNPDLPVATSGSYSNRIGEIDSLLQPQAAPEGGDDLVQVFNPKGLPKRIRASQLEQALKMGYRQR